MLIIQHHLKHNFIGGEKHLMNKELLKGSTGMVVLRLLEKEDLYGYMMMKRLDEKSKSIFKLGEGTLYPILHSLEKEQLIESYWEKSSSARKRKYYRITEKGLHTLNKKKAEWDKYAEGINNIFMEVKVLNAKKRIYRTS